jgi:archaellum component FlaC
LSTFLYPLYPPKTTQDSAANSHELKDTKKQLKRHLKNAESTLKDVEMTVQLVTDNRERFNTIDDTALYERSALVRISRDRLMRARQEMQSEAVKAKLLQDERAQAARRFATSDDRESTAMIVDSQARQSLLLQHQDETLDELESAVTRVNTMAGNIHDEIGQQNKILTEMEEDLAHAEEELGMVMGKLAKFLKTKDTWQLGTIMCLMLTVIVLFLLVLYT